jgi:hypothetical protein
MMSTNFVPEMHDLGKLIKRDWRYLTTDGRALKVHTQKGPSFSNLNWEALELERLPFDNVTWLAIVYHMDKETKWVRDLALPPDIAISIEDRVRLFLTILADHLAATTGRALGKGERYEATEDTVYRLWHPKFAAALKPPVPITDEEKLCKAFELVRKKDQNWAGYLAEYGSNMRACAEAKDAARRVTSLLSHSELTGKFYRVLKDAVKLLDNPLRLALDEVAVTKVSDAEAQWMGRLVRATVKFHQQPVRPADLGIFDHLQECHEVFAQAYPYNLLFASADTLWLFLPRKNEPKLADVLEVYAEAGFYVECEVRRDTLGRLGVWFSEEVAAQVKRDLERQIEELGQRITMLRERHRVLDQQIERATGERKQRLIDECIKVDRERRTAERAEEALKAVSIEAPQLAFSSYYPRDIATISAFDPPICEICQMRPGEPIEVGATTDYLCHRCREIRRGVFSQRELGGGRGRVLWLRVGLDAEQLEQTVAGLFGAYVDSIKHKGRPLGARTKAWMKANLRMPALLRDFVYDYQTLLNEMDSSLRGLGNPEHFSRLAPNTWVLPVRRGRQINDVLRRYTELIEQYFPELKAQREVPIRLGISIGPAKYPFYQHWRYISNPPAAVSARLVGSASLEVGLEGLEALLAVDLHAHDERDRRVEWEARQGRTYLHKLAAIEQRSGSTGLAAATFLSDLEHPRQSKVPRLLQRFKKPLCDKKLRMADILAYYKLMSFGERR